MSDLKGGCIKAKKPYIIGECGGPTLVFNGEQAEKFKRSKPHVNVGTIGHVDHGISGLASKIRSHILRLEE